MKVVSAPSMEGLSPNFFFYPEPPPIDYLMDRHGKPDVGREIPVIVLCTNAFEAASLRSNGLHRLTDIGRIIEVIAQPCGPQKLAKVLQRCMRRLKVQGADGFRGSANHVTLALNRERYSSLATEGPIDATRTRGNSPHSQSLSVERRKSSADRAMKRPSISEQVNLHQLGEPSSPASPIHSDENRPKVLVVDDNQINLHLLLTFVRKAAHPYESATDGSKALEAYKRSVLEDGGKYGFPIHSDGYNDARHECDCVHSGDSQIRKGASD
ncbi:uncharacterized protein Z518_06644 [Rhinocladiella mackenziei CBS 650.93]|uniref:Response regulatory domain-containing protein n=1 Tax=Rhinocladiella mackenziei CBS 650.93 TaxID=1442369 RepID=A0A0D2IB91_9EURO|nr:uncharacterized protein Z518_06644 [Rhinocladiella mackenziei CBS 650.93]KIX03094.1 hypothetical protein Z518_06644 [Rhinocladiella mackenziei CBS 650.93]